MANYYKYLPTSPEDENWGLHVLDVGFNYVDKGEVYPATAHPEHHYFNWNKGRIFEEYQILYIVKGEGIFESEKFERSIVNKGSIILLFPNQWHRYKPNEETGWHEYWVGFKGNIAENIIEKNFFTAQHAVLNIGVHEDIVHLFTQIIETTKEEKPGYQPWVSGIVLHLLGRIYALSKKQDLAMESNIESIMNKARSIFRANIEQDIAMEKVAEELNVSYAWFRKTFKVYTGIAPNQYLLQLKIEKAKSLLSDPSKSIKEIAFILNFESAFYFSKLFKGKTGLSPEHYRKHATL